MNFGDLLRETLDVDCEGVWENERTPTPVRVFGVRLHSMGLSLREIVGMDVPLVLDAIPRVRGQSKDQIVEEVLEHTTEMVNLDLVMMDREFDSKPVKKTCEAHPFQQTTTKRR